MFDYHIHSNVSFDSSASWQSMVKAASDAGLKEICFTDHRDTDPLGEKCLTYDIRDYKEKYGEMLRREQPVRVKLGAEIGAVPWEPPAYDALALDYEYDFIICSAHFVGREDPYFPDFFDKRSREEAFSDYLAEVIENIRIHNIFSVFGHLTFVSKNCPCQDPVVHYAEFADYYDEIFRLLIARGKGIEVNTSGYANTGQPMPPYDAVKRYFELGGEIITVGSDAHSPERVGEHIPEVIERIKAAGGKYVCTFDKMKPVFHKI